MPMNSLSQAQLRRPSVEDGGGTPTKVLVRLIRSFIALPACRSLLLLTLLEVRFSARGKIRDDSGRGLSGVWLYQCRPLASSCCSKTRNFPPAKKRLKR